MAPRGAMLLALSPFFVACSSKTTVAGAGGVADAGAAGSDAAGAADAAGGTRTTGSGTAGEAGTSTSSGGNVSGNGGAAGTGATDAGSGGDTGSAGTEDAGGIGGMGGAVEGECSANHACASRAAPGWTGPVALGVGATVPDCPTEYPAEEFDAGINLGAADAECDCQCGALSGDCDPQVSFSSFSSGDCSGTPDEEIDDLATNTCVGYVGGRFGVAAPDTSCAPTGTVVPGIPMAGFTDFVRACSGATADGTCGESGICVPEAPAPFDEICVYREGEHECPTGYAVGSLVYDGFEDTRGCPGTCSCSPSGGACTLGVSTYNGPSGGGLCGDSLGGVTVSSSGNACVNQGNRAALFGPPTFMEGSGQCVGADPVATGGLTPTEPFTVCCRE